MAANNDLSENVEDYLETILELQTKKTVARSKDIAEKMDIKRGSVTGMLKKLAKKNFINYEPYGYVTLTPEGKKIAVEIERRHIFLKDFFFRILEVDEETADNTACRMEHAMNKQTFTKFKKFVKKIDTCPHCDIKPALSQGLLKK
ncbi:MAG: metal-dependent transcriptional regulator [Desulfobacula sp.]|uniref:metal-dependent transcriptional regulator n=1 Tax=Desulfobacula sp. TaxID=2593537 RepID=UPI0025B922C9|nr:metal-dependent transcriptional regulator [Desulfobacula sp.]MCD4720853.1 metal-dependent transcriptional regulator [Desulfobacula sp.]